MISIEKASRSAAAPSEANPDKARAQPGERHPPEAHARKPLAGTLGESLHQIFLTNRGRLLSEIDYPKTPPTTGVPFIERIVAEPFEYEGVALRKGERIRILLQSFQYSGEPADHIRIFGAGIHACLGRQLSLEIWSLITSKLSEIAACVEILDYALREEDYVFVYPARLLIGLHR